MNGHDGNINILMKFTNIGKIVYIICINYTAVMHDIRNKLKLLHTVFGYDFIDYRIPFGSINAKRKLFWN